MHLRSLLAGVGVALLATPAAASAAPSIEPLKPCYVAVDERVREPVEIHGHAFFPGSIVDVFVDEVDQQDPAQPPPTVNALGELEGSVLAPAIVSGQRSFTLRLTERRQAGETVTAVSKVTALSVTQSPQQPRTTSSRVRFRGRGFTAPTLPVYAHYVYRDKLRKTVLIGKPFGDCGQFSVRRRQFPFARPHTGTWWVQFDQVQAYNPNAPLYTRLKISVRKKPRP